MQNGTAARNPKGFALAQVNRPTERQALRLVDRTPAPATDLLTLFESILTAHATGDRHGLSLAGHAAARLGANGTAAL